MKYKEYLNSARKHKVTCSELLHKIESLDSNNPEQKSLMKSLLLNLYYLSGYIIECSVKYGIYNNIGYDRNACVRQLDIDGISFSKHIKFHKFDVYTEHFNNKQPGIKLIDDTKGIDRDVLFIYKKWDAEVRYWFNDIDESINKRLTAVSIKQFFKLSEEVFHSISRI